MHAAPYNIMAMAHEGRHPLIPIRLHTTIEYNQSCYETYYCQIESISWQWTLFVIMMIKIRISSLDVVVAAVIVESERMEQKK